MSGNDDEMPDDPANDGDSTTGVSSGESDAADGIVGWDEADGSTSPIYLLDTSSNQTEMAIGDVKLPGVYEVTETGKGMTGKYMAEKSQGQSNPYTDTQSDEEADDDFAIGTLLNQEGDPYINADTEQRIRIGEDQINGETYAEPVEDHATILTDDESTPDQNEAGWVVGPDGDRLSVVEETDDGESETRPLQLSPSGGYVVYNGGESDDSSDGSEDDSSDGEESDDSSDGESDDDSEGSPQFGEQVPGQSGTNPEGYDSIRPPPIELTVKAYCTDETWEVLDNLRGHERPFDVAIGEFDIERMGILDVSRNIAGDLNSANDVTVKLKQFEEVTVQTPGQPISSQQPGSSSAGPEEEGPVLGWIDRNNDGIDDRTQQPIPEFEEVEVGAGETYTATVGSGELWGNKLIDASANGASVDITADGSGWVVKNVGITGGVADHGGAVITANNDGVVENIYLGDGAQSGSNGLTGVRVETAASNTVEINRVNVQGMGASGIHATDPGTGGRTVVTNSFAARNNVAQLRFGGGGDSAENVMLHSDEAGARAPGGANRRGLWVWHGPTEVASSDIKQTGNAAAVATNEGGSVSFTGTTVEGPVEGDASGHTEGTPQVYLPTGCPDSARDAASRISNGPPGEDGWSLVMQDDFDNGLNRNYWSVGFGWGMDTTASDEVIREDHVWVENGMLRLTCTHDGGPGSTYAGAINSRGKVTAGPGSYWEAKLRCPDRYGWLPAFWSKPDDESWPPEIDFFEQLGNDTHDSHHHLHTSSDCGVGVGDVDHPMSYDGIDSTMNWHVYGCAWYSDRVEMYVDGEHVGTHTDSCAMQSLRAGAPFYMMLNIHVGKTGTPDYSESWGETMDVDWVRVWER